MSTIDGSHVGQDYSNSPLEGHGQIPITITDGFNEYPVPNLSAKLYLQTSKVQ